MRYELSKDYVDAEGMLHLVQTAVFDTLEQAKAALGEIARDFHTEIVHVEPKNDFERAMDADEPAIWRDQVQTSEGTYAVYELGIDDPEDPFYGMF